MAVVVLFPLLPVMQSTCSSGTSSNQSPSPLAHRHAGRSSSPDLGPVAADARALDHHVAGEQGSEPPASVASTSSPPSVAAGGFDRPPAPGSMPIDRRRCRLAVPSTPSPQMPTDALVSADQEIRGRIAVGYVVGSERREELGRHRVIRHRARGRRRSPATRSAPASPSRSGLAAAAMSAARHSFRVAHALEGFAHRGESRAGQEAVLRAGRRPTARAAEDARSRPRP